ncbi:hypothetical protein COCCADRAFT_31557 [Bipolaris zeicola 26-R-13]|uniref:Uncharacterized protein n=1 Tax=Cochliobolus carbonum (strain 26-R-13) TaxID=930089 RepID=W6XMH3_COCC2|nr:uncharacterized protein COCCADRAFT_31557 [Bipolaris zeicola 26-R-13]EUC26733.1 hypothetical protein COCCADRAFT_31557 [Bipolaris zeicola 26-R-13]
MTQLPSSFRQPTPRTNRDRNCCETFTKFLKGFLCILETGHEGIDFECEGLPGPPAVETRRSSTSTQHSKSSIQIAMSKNTSQDSNGGEAISNSGSQCVTVTDTDGPAQQTTTQFSRPTLNNCTGNTKTSDIMELNASTNCDKDTDSTEVHRNAIRPESLQRKTEQFWDEIAKRYQVEKKIERIIPESTGDYPPIIFH